MKVTRSINCNLSILIFCSLFFSDVLFSAERSLYALFKKTGETEAFDRASDHFLATALLDPFQAVTALSDFIETTIALDKKVHKYLRPLGHRQNFPAAIMQQERICDSLEFYTYDWIRDFGTRMRDEINYLTYFLSQDEYHSKDHIISQLLAVRKLLLQSKAKIVISTTALHEWTALAQDVPSSLPLTVEHLTHFYHLLTGTVKELNEWLAPYKPWQKNLITYGSDEWYQLVLARAQIPEHWLKCAVGDLCCRLDPLNFVPEEWRPSWLQLGAVLLSSLVITAQIAQPVRIYSDLNIVAKAKEMQDEVLASVPAGIAHAIEKETQIIGGLLSDKYSMLTDSQILPHFSAKYPSAIPTLQSSLTNFGSNTPTSAQILNIMNDHYVRRMLGASSLANPLQHRSVQGAVTRSVDSPIE